MKTLINRLTLPLLLALAMLSSQCKKDKKDPAANDQDPVIEKGEWVAYENIDANYDFTSMSWGFTIGNNIYLHEMDNGIRVFDMQQKKWKADRVITPQALLSRSAAQIAVHNNKAYIQGGDNSDANPLSDFYEFNPSAPQPWNNLPDAPVGLRNGRAWVYNNTFHVGFSHTEPWDINSYGWIFSYNMNTAKWNPDVMVTNTDVGSLGFSFLVNDQLYYGGGITHDLEDPYSKAAFKLSLSEKTVTPIDSLPDELRSFAFPNATTLRNTGYAITENALIAYIASKDEWVTLKSLPKDEYNGTIRYLFSVSNKLIGITRYGKVFEFKED